MSRLIPECRTDRMHAAWESQPIIAAPRPRARVRPIWIAIALVVGIIIGLLSR